MTLLAFLIMNLMQLIHSYYSKIMLMVLWVAWKVADIYEEAVLNFTKKIAP